MTVITEDKQLLGMFKSVERSQAERGWIDEDKQWAYQLSEISFIDQPPNEVTISYREKFADQDYGTPILVEQKFFQTRDEAEDYISEMKHEKMEERKGGAGTMARANVGKNGVRPNASAMKNARSAMPPYVRSATPPYVRSATPPNATKNDVRPNAGMKSAACRRCTPAAGRLRRSCWG